MHAIPRTSRQRLECVRFIAALSPHPVRPWRLCVEKSVSIRVARPTFGSVVKISHFAFFASFCGKPNPPSAIHFRIFRAFRGRSQFSASESASICVHLRFPVFRGSSSLPGRAPKCRCQKVTKSAKSGHAGRETSSTTQICARVYNKMDRISGSLSGQNKLFKKS